MPRPSDETPAGTQSGPSQPSSQPIRPGMDGAGGSDSDINPRPPSRDGSGDDSSADTAEPDLSDSEASDSAGADTEEEQPDTSEFGETSEPGTEDDATSSNASDPGQDEPGRDEPETTDTDADDAQPTDTDTETPGVPVTSCIPDYDCEPEPPDTGDFYADCVTRVNQFRSCVCLPPLERADDAESCLDQQAEYDSTRDPHSGFSDGICEPRGYAQNECPGWGSAEEVVDGCIQMMFDEGPPPNDPCEGQCYQEHGHFINMTGTDFTRVACGLYVDGRETWSVQNFY